jgi:hypothetical protein
MINQKLFGVLLIMGAVATSSILVATSWSQDASAQMLPDSTIDIDVEEVAISENATATNKTTSTNMTGTNSTR